MIVIDVTARVNKIEAPVKRVVDLVKRLEKSIDKAANAMQRLANVTASIQNLPIPAAPMAGGAPRTGSRAPGQPRSASPMDFYRFMNGLNTASGGRMQSQRNAVLTRVFQHYQALAGQGDPMAMRAVHSLAPSVAKMSQRPKGFGHHAMQALMTSRVGMGAGGMQIQPLIGRMVSALATVGPAAFAATMGLGAFALAIAPVIGAMHAIQASASSRARLGTTGATMGMIDRISGAVGGDAAAMAQQFGQNISSGVGAGFAAQAGINPYSGVFGDFDVGKKFAKYAKFVAMSRSYRQAQQRATAVGTPELANVYYLSADQKRDMFNRSNGYSEKDTAMAVRGAYAANRMKDAFEKLINKMMMTFAPFVSRLLTLLSGLFERLQSMWDGLPKWMKYAITPPVGHAFIEEGKSTADRMYDQNEEHIKAVKDSTRAMRELRDVMGGGQRAASALPSKVSGSVINDPWYRVGLEGGVT